MATAIVPHARNHGPRSSAGARYPVYQIDFTAVASGKFVASSKRRIRWRFGFSNQQALENGETGTSCRGAEHDVTVVWSVTSGKRLILADGHEVHYSNNRSGTLEFTWTMKGNHVLKVIAHAAPALSGTPGFRQYDLIVDGQSFFLMPKVYELGIKTGHAYSGGQSGGHPQSRYDVGLYPGNSPPPARVAQAVQPRGASLAPAPQTNYATYDLNKGSYVVPPASQEQEDADLQAAIKASLEETQRHLSKTKLSPADSQVAEPSPANASYAHPPALYRDASEVRLTSAAAKEDQADLLDLMSGWDIAEPEPAQSNNPSQQNGGFTESFSVMPPAASQHHRSNNVGSSSQPNQFNTYSSNDPFAPQPVQDIPPQNTFNQLSHDIMSQYGTNEPQASAPAQMPTSFPPAPVSSDVNNYDVPSHVPYPSEHPYGGQTSPISINTHQFTPEDNVAATEKSEMAKVMEKLVNFDNLNAPADVNDVSLSMTNNPFAEEQRRTEVVKGKIKSKGIVPPASKWGGPQPSLAEMKSLKPTTQKEAVVQPQSLVVSSQQNGNYGGYGQTQNQQAPNGYGGHPQQQQQGQYNQQPGQYNQQPGQYNQQPGQYNQQQGQYNQQQQYQQQGQYNQQQQYQQQGQYNQQYASQQGHNNNTAQYQY